MSSLSKAVIPASILNVIGSGASSGVGVLAARSLGPTERGFYSAVFVWSTLALILGEVGQPAAICYFVASDGPRASDYVATARRLMTCTGVAVGAIGFVCAPLLSHQSSSALFCFRLMFLCCPIAFISGSLVFSLQARDLQSWMFVRVLQPTMWLALVGLLWAEGLLSLRHTFEAYVVASLVQGIVAFIWCRKVGLTGGTYDSVLLRRSLRYGLSQILSSTTTLFNFQGDQLILSEAVSPSDLGRYSVAESLTGAVLPVLTPIGSVLFPALASSEAGWMNRPRLVRRAINVTFCVGVGVECIIALTGLWVIPLIFGNEFRGSEQLVFLLAPGAVFWTAGSVVGDVLRGLNCPLIVAKAQGVAAGLTGVMLLVMVPVWGVSGAAIASSVAYSVAFALMWLRLRSELLKDLRDS